jgi:diaminopimelate decarboxylase
MVKIDWSKGLVAASEIAANHWRNGMFSGAELLKRTQLKTPCYVYFEQTLRENC